MKARYSRKNILLLILVAVMLFLFTACESKDTKEINSIEQLNDPNIRIGVSSGTTEDEIVRKLFPEAKIEYMKNSPSAFLAVGQEKIDAFIYEKQEMEIAIRNGLKGVKLLDDTLGESNQVAIGVSPVSKIPDLEDKINEYIDLIKEDGTLDDMVERWLITDEYTMPEIEMPESPLYHLKVGTSGTVMPYSFFEGTTLTGRDIELAYRFAAWLNADIEFKVYDYGAIIEAVQTGDVDCIIADIYITEERKEIITFSKPYSIVEIGIMVHDPHNEITGFSSLEDFEGKKIGVTTGTIQAIAVEKQIPSAEIIYFNSVPDMITALRLGKIDAFCIDDMAIRVLMIENDDLTYLSDHPLTDPVRTGAIFPKTEIGNKLREEFNEYLAKAKADGTLQEVNDIWFGKDESLKTVIDPSSLSAEKGTIRVATDASLVPAVYYKDNQIVGMDIDIISRFCKKYGYGLEITDMSFAAIFEVVASGKCDMAIGAIGITEERAQSVDFSDPMYEGASVMAYLSSDAGSAKQDNGSFIDSIKDSFEKTFIRENRWQLFASGILTTLLITVLSIACGTLLGFFVFMLCRNGNPIANAITDFCVWLVKGTPMVVLLMILYYIIFGNVAISGDVVSIIGFTLVFGAGVFGMIKSGVMAIDRGQLEAAYTLGYTNRKAFYRVILPQALPLFMPAYRPSITETIKATAIVGYVAVQDLTKMGDIVRSRTYEAFFPLIAVAIIYFILAAILTLLVERIEIRLDPKKRNLDKIRKEIER